MTQGYPPHQSGGPPSRGRRGRGERASQPPLDSYDDNDEEAAPWAGQSIYPMGPGRREIRPPQDYGSAPEAPRPEPPRRGRGGHARPETPADDWQADPGGGWQQEQRGGHARPQQAPDDAWAADQRGGHARPPASQPDWQAEQRAWEEAQAAQAGAAQAGVPQAPQQDWQAEEHAWQVAEAGRQAEELSMRAEEHTRQNQEISEHAQQRRPAGGRRARAGERRRDDGTGQATPQSPDVWQDEGEGGAAWAPPPERGKGRQATTRARKSRRRLMAAGAIVVVAALIAAAYVTKIWPFQNSTPAASGPPLVTRFQKGEFRTVPNACGTLSTGLLSQYLPGKVAKVSQSAGSSTQSQCTWTLDTKPDFRVLTVSSQAYAPSLLASGDGSATFNAIDAYGLAQQALQNPPKSSKAPKAQMGTAAGLGSNAFTGLQVFKVGGTVTDEVTVVSRDKNVLITVTMQGQERGGGFGPVPDATLRAAALAAAHEVLAGLR